MDTKGGRFSLTLNGQVYSGRGAAKLMLSSVSLKTDVNSDGTGFVTVASKLVGIDLTFDRGVGLAWDTDSILQNIDATFVETDVGITHMFTSGNFDGDPTIDSATGEVSGLKVMTAAANYQKFSN